MTSRNSVIAICTPCTVVFRSSLMSLIITFMFEPAKLQMNWARARGTSTRRRVLDGRPVAGCSVMWAPASARVLTRSGCDVACAALTDLRVDRCRRVVAPSQRGCADCLRGGSCGACQDSTCVGGSTSCGADESDGPSQAEQPQVAPSSHQG